MMETSTLLLANLTLVGCMSLERLFKAFNVDLHAVKKVACSSWCCSAELLRNSASSANTPVRSGTVSFRSPEIEEMPYIARRAHSLEGYPGRTRQPSFNLEIDNK